VTPRDQLGLAYTVKGDELERKIKAIQAHASQIEGLLEVFGEEGFRSFMGEENYALAEIKT
jgi:hypothetical protein